MNVDIVAFNYKSYRLAECCLLPGHFLINLSSEQN